MKETWIPLLWILWVFPTVVILAGVFWMSRVLERAAHGNELRSLFGTLSLVLLVVLVLFCPGYLLLLMVSSFSTLSWQSLAHLAGMSVLTLFLEWLLLVQSWRLRKQEE